MTDFIDINQTLDLVKLRLYAEWLYQNHVYAEGESQFHKTMTDEVVKTYVDPLELSKDATILDVGCGPGYFLDAMKDREYTNTIGITLSKEDIDICLEKGHKIARHDLSFLPQTSGFIDECADFIFLRHALEHSPYPIFSLMEYNRVLKQGSSIYIEVPAPGCERGHEFNKNHYSILGSSQLIALLNRTGFAVEVFNNMEFDINVPNEEDPEGEPNTYNEKYYCIVAKKAFCLDLK